jgi:hypothetical protein
MGCGASRLLPHLDEADAIRKPIREDGPGSTSSSKQEARPQVAARSQRTATDLPLSARASYRAPAQQGPMRRSLRASVRDKVVATVDGSSKIVEEAAKLAASERWPSAFSRRRSSPALTEQQISVVRLQAQIRARQARQRLQRMVKHTLNAKVQRHKESVRRTLAFSGASIWRIEALHLDSWQGVGRGVGWTREGVAIPTCNALAVRYSICCPFAVS